MTETAFKSGFIHLVGRTNAGKSTLLNAFVGHKVAAVGGAPQTTRHKILAVRNEENAQMVFIDLPGIHRPLHKLNERMMTIIERSFFDEPDLLILAVDASKKFGSGDNFTIELLRRAEQVKKSAPDSKTILLLNKVDLVSNKQSLLPLIEHYQKLFNFLETVPVSALKKDGLERALDAIRKNLPPGPRYFEEGYLTDRPIEFLMEEYIREAVINQTREEIPHTTAVILQKREEKENIVVIRADIITEKDSQKAILIGEGGKMIKRISTSARKTIEEFLEERVYLELRVVVKPDWRNKDGILNQLGLVR